MHTLSTGNEDIPEWSEENKQKLREVLQHIKDSYRPPTYEEEQRQKEWNEHWLRQWSITPEQKHRQLMDSVLEYVGVDVKNVRRIE